MAFDFNRNFPQGIKFNSKYVEKLKYNNQIVWEKKLPVEYQEVEYLESDGNSYIDTGLPASDLLITRVDCYKASHPGRGKLWSPFGAGDGNRWYRIADIGTTSNGYLALLYGNITTANRININRPGDTTFVLDNGYLKWGTDTYISTNAGTAFNVEGYNMGLFKTNGQNADFVGVKIYRAMFWLYNQDKTAKTIVRDLVPCYRKLDNVAGFYDLVNDNFYTNAGTGEFTAGEDVN